MSADQHIDQEVTEKVVKKQATVNFVRYILISVIGLTVAIVLILQTTLLYQQQKFDEVGQSTRDRLLDCTDPTGQCYREGQKRSGAAIKQINDAQKQVVTIAAYCAKQPKNQTLEQIEDCVNKELKR